jgi:hypothetical protein
MLVADPAARINDRLPGPIVVTVKFPSAVFGVQRDRIFNAMSYHCLSDVIRIFFVSELWSMHPDHRKIRLATKMVVHIVKVRSCVDTINASKGPEIKEHDLISHEHYDHCDLDAFTYRKNTCPL